MNFSFTRLRGEKKQKTKTIFSLNRAYLPCSYFFLLFPTPKSFTSYIEFGIEICGMTAT